jgi:hypothetical protein
MKLGFAKNAIHFRATFWAWPLSHACAFIVRDDITGEITLLFAFHTVSVTRKRFSHVCSSFPTFIYRAPAHTASQRIIKTERGIAIL